MEADRAAVVDAATMAVDAATMAAAAATVAVGAAAMAVADIIGEAGVDITAAVDIIAAAATTADTMVAD